MVKRIRTLLTLFLLVMGTTMSWAEFKDFEINLTEATAAAGNSSQISAEYLPEGVTQIYYGGDRTAAYNGGQHGWEYAAFQFAVDGPVDIIIGAFLFIVETKFVSISIMLLPKSTADISPLINFAIVSKLFGKVASNIITIVANIQNILSYISNFLLITAFII